MSRIQPTIEVGRFLFTQFADDIRQEVGGKVTLVGVYQSQMIFQSFPSEIQKLAVILTAVTPINQPYEKLAFLIYRDDDLIQRYEIPSETLNQAANEVDQLGPEGLRYMEFQFAAFMGGVKIDSPCSLVGIIETENGIIQGKTLQITDSESANKTADLSKQVQ